MMIRRFRQVACRWRAFIVSRLSREVDFSVLTLITSVGMASVAKPAVSATEEPMPSTSPIIRAFTDLPKRHTVLFSLILFPFGIVKS